MKEQKSKILYLEVLRILSIFFSSFISLYYFCFLSFSIIPAQMDFSFSLHIRVQRYNIGYICLYLYFVSFQFQCFLQYREL